MSRAERIRAAAQAMTAALVGMLEACTINEGAEANVGATSHNLTVAELSALLNRSESTIRDWLAAGRFPGAYHGPSSGKVVTVTFKKGKRIGQKQQRRRVGE